MRRLSLSVIAAAAATGALAGPAIAKPAAGRDHHPRPGAHAATARLYLHDIFSVAHKLVGVPGRAIRVDGWVSRFEPHQKLTLTVRVAGHTTRLRLRIRANANHRTGRFGAVVKAPAAGTLTVRAVHSDSPRLRHFGVSRAADIVSVSTSDPLYTSLVQQRLAALHFYMPQSGRWDLQTELAIEAYHRLLGRGTSTALDPATLSDLLAGVGKFTVRFPQHGRHVEGDLSNQLVALIDGSKVFAIYPISSGKPSTPTILGDYRIYERVPGYLPDGMYYSDFFIRGYALHGYDPSPDYPASHDCMRLPISDAISAFNWLAIGDWVDVYGTPNGSV